MIFSAVLFSWKNAFWVSCTLHWSLPTDFFPLLKFYLVVWFVCLFVCFVFFGDSVFFLFFWVFFGPLDSSCIIFSCSCLVYTFHHCSAQFFTLSILESVTRPLLDLHPSSMPAVITMPLETTLGITHMPLFLGGPISRLKGCQDEMLAQKR